MHHPYERNEYFLSGVTRKIIAAAMEVHKTLGPGFMEVMYQRALARELPAQHLDFNREVAMDVLYKGEKVGIKRVDFMVGEQGQPLTVLVELKTKAALDDADYVQTVSYLKASGLRIGLLINFGALSGWHISGYTKL